MANGSENPKIINIGIIKLQSSVKCHRKKMHIHLNSSYLSITKLIENYSLFFIYNYDQLRQETFQKRNKKLY